MPSEIITSKQIKRIRPSKLSDKEKLVLYAITRWPLKTDQKLSEKIDLKRSTVTAIKKRLKENKVYRFKYRIGSEYINESIIKNTFFQINPNIDKETLKKLARRVLEKYNTSVFTIITDSTYVGLNFVKDFAKLKTGEYDFEEIWKRHEVFVGGYPKYVNFAVKHANINFNYANMIRHLFKLDIPEDNDRLDRHTIKDRTLKIINLNLNEKKVVFHMCKYPDKDSKALAEMTDIDLQTFRKIKRKILDRGVLKPIIVPILKKLNNELITYTYLKFNQAKSLEERIDFVRYINLKHPHHFLMIYDENEYISLDVYRNYSIYYKNVQAVEEYIAKNKIMEKQHGTVVVPINDIRYFKNVVFSGLCRKVFDIKDKDIKL